MTIESAEEFVALRTSENMEEYNRAAHEDASIGVWWAVIENFPDMKIWVVHNKTVPLEILSFLASDSDPQVRSAVARKRKLDSKLFLQLAMDKHESVRASIASNKKTPLDVLLLLSDDPWEEVRRRVSTRLDELK